MATFISVNAMPNRKSTDILRFVFNVSGGLCVLGSVGLAIWGNFVMVTAAWPTAKITDGRDAPEEEPMDQRVSEHDLAPAKANLGFSVGSAVVQKVATFSGFGKHSMRPATDHDEDARSNFMMDLYRHLGSNMAPGRR
ncbi:MAG: hypothetical protein VCE91_08910, partial [Nitrospinota bacterium]